MLDTLTRPAPVAAQYHGPERRSQSGLFWRLLTAMLDEVDYGMLLVDPDHLVLHANRAAQRELVGAHPLTLAGGQLRARHGPDGPALRDAIDGATGRGLRRLLALGHDEHRVTVAVVPLAAAGAPAGTLLLIGKRRMCESLSVLGFARAHGLTPAETEVLQRLCAGLDPQAIADQQAVAISTVRTQISSIRSKTGAASIRQLVQQVAVLPPLVNVLCASA